MAIHIRLASLILLYFEGEVAGNLAEPKCHEFFSFLFEDFASVWEVLHWKPSFSQFVVTCKSADTHVVASTVVMLMYGQLLIAELAGPTSRLA